MTFNSKSFGPISLEQLRQYAEASGDPNPIHLDEAVAKKAGLPGIIAHGMLVAGFCAEAVDEYQKQLGPDWTLNEFSTRFKSMTFPGDAITVRGHINSAKSGSVEQGPQIIDFQAVDQKGDVKVSGSARLVRS